MTPVVLVIPLLLLCSPIYLLHVGTFRMYRENSFYLLPPSSCFAVDFVLFLCRACLDPRTYIGKRLFARRMCICMFSLCSEILFLFVFTFIIRFARYKHCVFINLPPVENFLLFFSTWPYLYSCSFLAGHALLSFTK